MIFLNSPWFWGAMGLAGIAVPVIIHLISRNFSKPNDWAAMHLLHKAMAVRSRRIRLEDILIMMMRALAIGLIALAFARPSLTDFTTALATGSRSTAVVIAIDGSFSMSHRPGVNSRFDLAKERAREIINEMSPGDRLSLVVMGSRPRVILRNAIHDPARFHRELDRLAPLAERLDLAVCFDEIREIMDEADLPRSECYIVTDAQSNTWENMPSAALSAWSEMRSLGMVALLPVQSAGSENLAVTQLTASGIPLAGSLVRFVADVHNTGTRPAPDVTVRLLVDGTPVDKQVVPSISPGEIIPVSLYTRFQNEGSHVVVADLGDDPLSIDNRRYLISDVRAAIRVLCVDGDPSDEPFRGETDFLKAALQPMLMDSSASMNIQLTVIPHRDLNRDDLSNHDIVILANVPELPQEVSAALGHFVEAGGGLMVFVGDQTGYGAADAPLLVADGSPLLPGDLLEVNGPAGADDPAFTPWTVDPQMGDHPVTRALAALPPESWEAVYFERFIKTAPRDGARVLMRLSPGGDPLLLSHRIGRGEVMLYTSTADRDWNDMAVHPAYLMLVQQAVMSLSRKSHEIPITVSQPLVFELPASDDEASVTLIDPSGSETREKIATHEGRRSVVLGSADLPGIYQIVTGGQEGNLKLAVNVDPIESMTEVLEGPALEEIGNGLAMGVLDAGGTVSTAMRTRRFGREIWLPLIIAALFLLMVESIAANRLGGRAKDAADAVGSVSRIKSSKSK